MVTGLVYTGWMFYRCLLLWLTDTASVQPANLDDVPLVNAPPCLLFLPYTHSRQRHNTLTKTTDQQINDDDRTAAGQCIFINIFGDLFSAACSTFTDSSSSCSTFGNLLRPIWHTWLADSLNRFSEPAHYCSQWRWPIDPIRCGYY